MNIIDLTDSADSGNELKQQRLSIISGEGRSSSPTTVPHSETLVECPVCAQFMTIEELQGSHIDRCLRGETKTIKPSMASKRQPTTGNISTFFSPRKRRKQEEKVQEDDDSSYQLQPTSMAQKQRIPNLDTMITTNKLKEKLISYNLPTGGTRQQLEARIREYINLYNANLDSLNPVDQRVLIGRLNKWDSLMNQRSTQNHSHSEGEDEEKSDETLKKSTKELKDWRIKYNSTYAELIKKARNSMKTSKEKTSDDPANNGTNK
ncbi:DEKNAAC104474 [Brettanomyces naardenensis]|uniref:RING-type E3 ubiquitin transferase n=1 Tax=Brettanomyces naardenensis TaxID=13370 RepID=A0A448YR69_BRENA|nr:DEKNAAC104474 [Brettanomyces naardenensis]